MQCRLCGQPFTQPESICPACGSVVRQRSRVTLMVALGLVSLAVLALLAAMLRPKIELWLALRESSVVREAVSRINDNPRVAAALGHPVRPGSSVSGNMTHDETGWTEAFLWIPLSGPKGEGTLYSASGAWFGSVEFFESRASRQRGSVDESARRA